MAALVRQQRQYILTPRCGRYEEHAVPESLESQQGGGRAQKRERKRFMNECPAPPQGGGKPTGRPQGSPLLYTGLAGRSVEWQGRFLMPPPGVFAPPQTFLGKSSDSLPGS